MDDILSLKEQIENAALCGMTLDEYQKLRGSFAELNKKIAVEEQFKKDNPNYNPYEGWTQEEIDHFEDKFFKQPFDAISAEAMGLMKETEKDAPLNFEDVF